MAPAALATLLDLVHAGVSINVRAGVRLAGDLAFMGALDLLDHGVWIPIPPDERDPLVFTEVRGVWIAPEPGTTRWHRIEQMDRTWFYTTCSACDCQLPSCTTLELAQLRCEQHRRYLHALDSAVVLDEIGRRKSGCGGS